MVISQFGVGLWLALSAAFAQDPLALVEQLPKIVTNGPADFTPIAVGPAHVVLVASNADIALFRKSTGGTPARLLSQVSVRTFFTNPPGPVDRLTDPDVIFDAESQRYFIAMADTTSEHLQLLLAVSKSSTPETLSPQDWFVYRLARNDAVDEADFDHLAIAGDKLLVSWQRTLHLPAGPVGAGTAIRVFDKRPFLMGQAPDPAPTDFVLPSDRNLRARPADNAAGRDRIFYDISSGFVAGDRKVWLIGAVSGLSSQPTFVTREVVSPFATVNNPTQLPQQTGVPLRAQDHLAAKPAYRDGSLWVFEWGADARDGIPSGIYWMEIDVRNWPDNVRVLQSGIYREAGAWLFTPAGIVDAAGSVTLTFARTAVDEFPSLRVAGRLAGDPPGTMRTGPTLNQAKRAWEFTDFHLSAVAGAAIDPVDGTVWIAGSTPSPVKPSTADGVEVAIGRLWPRDPGSPTNPGRLVNLSILTAIGAGEKFTVGAVAGGAGTGGQKPLLIRAVGPTLGAAPFNVPGALADPTIEIFAGTTSIAANDNWGGSAALVAASAQVGAFSFFDSTSKDAAVLYNASVFTPPASFTVQVAGNTGTSGVVLAEIYDSTVAQAFTTKTPRLVNVSVLKPIGPGLTAGFVVGGATPLKVLIRAIGPSLSSLFGVNGVIVDPQLELFDGASKSVATNAGWSGTTTLTAAFAQVGAFPLLATTKDAALLATLNPGAYTVQVTPAAGDSGIALVEIYEVP